MKSGRQLSRSEELFASYREETGNALLDSRKSLLQNSFCPSSFAFRDLTNSTDAGLKYPVSAAPLLHTEKGSSRGRNDANQNERIY